ncbi:hypothetical protein KGI01_26230 [Kurthia gibsonii]|nr:hypothetical protein KGI01_26230 [Kurthia gibsonii]
MLTENKRMFVFDNIKALLIVLVVIGHATDYYTKESDVMRMFFYIHISILYTFIYLHRRLI